jgi:hypothetical protein
MGDRTPVTLCFYSCPPQQTWAIARVIEDYELTDAAGDTYREGSYPFVRVGPGPWDLGYLEPGAEYIAAEVACGSAEEIAALL